MAREFAVNCELKCFNMLVHTFFLCTNIWPSVMLEEFFSLQTWSADNKLHINMDKTKEIVFKRPSARNFSTPQLLPHIEQIMVTKFLGIYISATFSTTVHVEQILSVANQRLYLLQQLKCQGLRAMVCILFSVLFFSLLSHMLCHLLRDSCL